jgi:hypothetical protein
MIAYVRQVALCESVRERIRQALEHIDDMEVRRKALDIPTTDSILRAASVHPEILTEEGFTDFVAVHMLDSLHLAPVHREQINVNG